MVNGNKIYSCMKKLITFFALLAASVAVACADNDRAVTVEMLPQKARTFLQENFPGIKLAYAKQERDFLEVSYEIVSVDGVKVEFDRKGDWTEIEYRYSTIDPELVPQEIRNYVEANYEGASYRKISRDRKKYEVKITYGLELVFDREFRLIGIDD